MKRHNDLIKLVYERLRSGKRVPSAKEISQYIEENYNKQKTTVCITGFLPAVQAGINKKYVSDPGNYFAESRIWEDAETGESFYTLYYWSPVKQLAKP